jgi:hypothetical protein
MFKFTDFTGGSDDSYMGYIIGRCEKFDSEKGAVVYSYLNLKKRQRGVAVLKLGKPQKHQEEWINKYVRNNLAILEEECGKIHVWIKTKSDNKNTENRNKWGISKDDLIQYRETFTRLDKYMKSTHFDDVEPIFVFD